jgi:ferredoxin-NADP reductase
MASPRGFLRATVTRVIRETADARTFVLEPHDGPFDYRAGQFCTFRVVVAGQALLRSYSMSSAPETDAELMTTVKRVPGGAVSNHLVDTLAAGAEVEVTRPLGRFCLRPVDDPRLPLLAFAGGSGITPILSLAKSALAGTGRPVRLLCADRDRASAIFVEALDVLAARHPGRLDVVRHLDDESGLVDAAAVRAFVGDDVGADAYLCGPEPFMALVRDALPGPGRVFGEDFGAPAAQPAAIPVRPTTGLPELDGTVTITHGRKRVRVPRHEGETLLQSARRGGLAPPFSCEAGTCATCLARITEGRVKMRANEILEDDEIAEGWVLTCQSVPETPSVTVVYED